jgi:outer membrane protein OmpA-like peptidoglycan-associated protein
MKRQPTTLTTAFVLITVAVLTLGLSGCQSNSEEEGEEPEGNTSEFDPGITEPDRASESEVVVTEVVEVDLTIAPVYFDFDRSEIRSDNSGTLKSGAGQLNDTGVKVVISGHTDNCASRATRTNAATRSTTWRWASAAHRRFAAISPTSVFPCAR